MTDHPPARTSPATSGLNCNRIVKVMMAAGLSILFTGAGQAYNRQWLKTIVFAVGSFVLWFVLLGWVVAIWAVVDAGLVQWYQSGGDELRYFERPRVLFFGRLLYIGLLGASGWLFSQIL